MKAIQAPQRYRVEQRERQPHKPFLKGFENEQPLASILIDSATGKMSTK